MIWLYALLAAYLLCLWTAIVAVVVDDGRKWWLPWVINILAFVGLLPATFVIASLAVWHGEVTWRRALRNIWRNLRDGG